MSNASFECQTGEVRLTDSLGTEPKIGRVEVCINGKWGAVCNSGWGAEEEAIVCRQLRNTPNSKTRQRSRLCFVVFAVSVVCLLELVWESL